MIIDPFRFAVPFSPSDIAGLMLWFKADSLALADGDPVGTWADQSGNSRNATGSGGARPTYKTNILNGLPVVRFDGTDDVLSVSYTIPGTHTAFCVYKRTTFSPLGGVSYGGTILWRATQLWPNVTSGLATTSTTIYPASFVYLSLDANAGPYVGVWLNGTSIISSSGGVAASDPLLLGSSFDGFSSCDIAEVIYYDTELAFANRGFVEAYLAAKYGL